MRSGRSFGPSTPCCSASSSACSDPGKAHRTLFEGYVSQVFTRADRPAAISDAYRRMLEEILDGEADGLLEHPVFDLAIHTGPSDIDIEQATRDAFALTLIPYHEGTHFAASFGHLMSGYDAGYYGYQWAKVYGDDMFSVFAEEGVLSPEVGARYRNEVLARGYSRDAIEHLRSFLGREPSAAAYLENLGLSE